MGGTQLRVQQFPPIFAAQLSLFVGHSLRWVFGGSLGHKDEHTTIVAPPLLIPLGW